MATNATSPNGTTGLVPNLAPNMALHLSNVSEPEKSNWKFLDAEYLKNLSSENPTPVMKLLNTLWQETERLIEKAVTHKEAPRMESIFIKANDQIINLRLHEVLWIEAYGDYVNFFTEKTRYLVHTTMKGIEGKLPEDQFTRVHRSFIIRTDKIDSIDESLIQIGKKLVPIGESYRAELMSRLNLL